MIKRVEKKTVVTVPPRCVHKYIKTDGITTCSQCNMKSILYLTPLKK